MLGCKTYDVVFTSTYVLVTYITYVMYRNICVGTKHMLGFYTYVRVQNICCALHSDICCALHDICSFNLHNVLFAWFVWKLGIFVFSCVEYDMCVMYIVPTLYIMLQRWKLLLKATDRSGHKRYGKHDIAYFNTCQCH